MNIEFGSRGLRHEGYRKVHRVSLFVSAVLILTLAVHDPLSAEFSDRQSVTLKHHPNIGYFLEFGGVRG